MRDTSLRKPKILRIRKEEEEDKTNIKTQNNVWYIFNKKSAFHLCILFWDVYYTYCDIYINVFNVKYSKRVSV